MADMDPADRRRVAVRSKTRLNKTQRNVLIGVATVAGLALAGKLLSMLRRDKKKRKPKKDKDIATLESVVKDGKNSSMPLQAQVQRTKLANLDNDEPDQEVVNRKRNARPSKYADSFSEIISEDDVTEDGEMYVNQDPVGHREHHDHNRERSNEPRHEARHEARHDSSSVTSRKGKKLSVSESGGFNFKVMSHSNAAENRGKRHEEEEEEEEHGDENHEAYLSNSSPKRGSRESANNKELSNTSGSSETLPSTQKKYRRAASVDSKQGGKTKVGGEEKGEKRKPRTHNTILEGDGTAAKQVTVDEAGRWESVNGYKVLRSTTSKIPTISEAMHKFEADGSNNGSEHHMTELERERAETEKAQSIWDGKARTRRRGTEGSEAYLQIKASVSSSVSDTEETAEGVKVREVVRRSTLLPIPSGDESEVHSSVYNVRETDEGLTVEEVVTRTKLLPAKGNFAFSDQQLLKRTYRKKPTRQDVLRVLPLVLRIVAVLATLISVLLVLYSRKRVPLPISQ